MRILIFVFIAVLGAVGYSIYWFQLADAAERTVGYLFMNWQRAGLEVDHSGLTVAGYPFRLATNAQGFSIRDPNDVGSWGWHRANFNIRTAPWSLREWTGRVQGSSEFSLGQDPRSPRILALPGDASATVNLNLDYTFSHLSAQVRQLQLRQVGRTDGLTMANAELHIRRPNQDSGRALDTLLRIDGIELPQAADGPFGREIDVLGADFSLTGQMPLWPVTPATIAAWRNAGGTIDAHWLHLVWGPIEVTASGTLALDRHFRLVGELPARIAGADALVDNLSQARMLDDTASAVAGFLIDLLSTRPANGGRPTLSVPLIFRDDQIYLGPVPLFPNLPLVVG